MTTELRPPRNENSAPSTLPPTMARSTNRVWTILRKEFSEIFRDRRTVMSVVISPLIITPALFALMGTMISSQAEKAKAKVYTIAVVGSEAAPNLVKAMQSAPNLKVETLSETDAEARIKDHKLNAAAVFPTDAQTLIESGNAVPVQILQDAGSEDSQIATARLHGAFEMIGQQMVAGRLMKNRLPPDYATPFHITEKQVQGGGTTATMVLSMLLPYILSISAFSGAIYAAFDQVAGEKERGTLETLLVSPASRRDIVLGKFGAVVGVCLLSSLLSIVGLVLSFSTRAKAFDWLAKGGLHLSPTAIGAILLVMLPLSVLFAGMLLAVSTYARNQKEAQTYLAPLFIAVMMPAMSSMFVSADVPKMVALIPVLNAAIIIKQALSGTYDATFIIVAFAASAIYAAIALAIATRLFQKESVLIKA